MNLEVSGSCERVSCVVGVCRGGLPVYQDSDCALCKSFAMLKRREVRPAKCIDLRLFLSITSGDGPQESQKDTSSLEYKVVVP